MPGLFGTAAPAQIAMGSFNVRITIEADCRINSATAMDFGTTGVIAANIDQNNLVSVQCSNGTAYNIGLNHGTGTGAGNGQVQAIPVYGRVVPQTMPAPGVYSDTITITVTF